MPKSYDTFAVSLLLAGKPIEDVSKLLGHTSIQTTLKHYAPWVQEMQSKMERNLRQLWANEASLRVSDTDAVVVNQAMKTKEIK